MTSYEKRALLLELLVRKSGLSLPELVEHPEYLEDLTQEVFDDLQQSRQELRGQITALQTRNRQLEEYVDMVAHDLKEPLVVMAFTSNLITNIPDLSGEKLKEYLRQMGQIADVVENVQGRLSHLIRHSTRRPYPPVHSIQPCWSHPSSGTRVGPVDRAPDDREAGWPGGR